MALEFFYDQNINPFTEFNFFYANQTQRIFTGWVNGYGIINASKIFKGIRKTIDGTTG